MSRISDWFFAILALVLLMPAPTLAGEGIVLLTFDTELEPDAAGLERLSIEQPASYFFTGEYALKYPHLVRSLSARGDTIGSHTHTHPNLTEVDDVRVDTELRLSKLVLEELTGIPVRWFRAPFLDYTDEVMVAAKQIGYDRDSSDIDAWLRNEQLPELGISFHDGRLLSDYNMFVVDKLDDDEALAWLMDAYRSHARQGRPLVILMHPRIIAEHDRVLHGFIANVLAEGGKFETVENHSESLRAQAKDKERMVGLWVDLSFETVEPATLVTDALSIGTTDVFLSVLDPQGVSYIMPSEENGGVTIGPIVAALQEAGLRVHAWVAVNQNLALAMARPELMMRRNNGEGTDGWVSFSNPEARTLLMDRIRGVLESASFDGLHLDYIRYPDVDHDVSPQALDNFKLATGISDVNPETLGTDLFNLWMDWRSDELAGLVAEIRQTAEAAVGSKIFLSAALIGDAAVNYRSRDNFGQDYAKLAKHLDLIIPMAYYPLESREPEWVERVLYAARWQAGETPVAAGLASFNEPGEWNVSAGDMNEAMTHALSLTNSAVFYLYSGLFDRRLDGRAVDPLVLDSVRDTLTLTFGERLEGLLGPTEQRGGALVAGVIALLAGAGLLVAFTRRRGRRSVAGIGVMEAVHSASLDKPWREDGERCASGMIDGDVCLRVARRLREVSPDDLDHMRLLLLLSEVERGRLEALGAHEASHQPDDSLVAEVQARRLARIRSGFWQLTARGHQELQKAKAAGLDLEFADFLRERMSERLTACCHSCGSINSFHYFWPSFECVSCGEEVSCRDVEHIEVNTPLQSLQQMGTRRPRAPGRILHPGRLGEAS